MKFVTFLVFVSVFCVSSCTNGNGPVDLGPLQTSYFLGNVNASVVVEVYSDYECPACGYFEQNSMPMIKQQLMDTGKIKYIFHDYPLPMHKDAFYASESSYCAGDQGKYWEMHHVLFTNQKNLTPAAIKGYAQQLNLNEDLFSACLAQHKYKQYIEQRIAEGQKQHIDATPTIVINGVKVESGALSYEALQNIINQLQP